MRLKSYGIGLLAMLMLASGGGCKKSASEGGRSQSQTTNQPSTLSPQPSTTLARVHWLGKKHIAAQESSKYFMSIWDLPEAARLETQTLDKLALAIVGDHAAEARLSGIGKQAVATPAQKTANTNQAQELVNRKSQIVNPQALLLRPLLDDLVQVESYLEARQATHQQAELVLAVRLDNLQANLWTSNLSAVLGAITNVQSLPAPAGRLAWRVPLPPGQSTINSRPSTIELTRVGDWTVLGVAPETNGLLSELSRRILLDHTPVAVPGTGTSFQMDPVTRKVGPAPVSSAVTNHWLEVDLDLRRLSSAFSLGWHLPDTWPRIAATWTGNGTLVRTTGELIFHEPLNLQSEQWNIPTNLIHQPLVSFTALRGMRPWLARQDWIKRFQVAPVPDQFCAWASTATPMLTFAATPMTNADSLLQALAPRVEAELNPWIASNAMGKVQTAKEPTGLAWKGIPMFTPTIEADATPDGAFWVAGVGSKPTDAGKLAPPELFAQLITRPNLLYYDWEITEAKLHHWVYLGQTARLAFGLPQMPSGSAAFAFLLAVAPKLGNTGTEIIQDGPSRLSFVRNSQSGFTGIELHLLADWLESPAFPRGLHSLLAPRPVKKTPPPHRPRGPRSIPALPSPAPHTANPIRPPS